MLLSNLLTEFRFGENVEFNNELEFDYLGLTASNVDGNLCVFLDNEKFIGDIKTHVKMVITNITIAKILADNGQLGTCVVDKPRETFFRIHNYLSEKRAHAGDKQATKIGTGCEISRLASIAKFNVVIGNNVTIEEFVVIRENTIIGDGSIIRAGSVIGGQGFEFKRIEEGVLSVAHAGGVIIGQNVEIQYNTCVDRGVYDWDNTVIGNYCKIDNLVYIAHGVKMDENTLVVANAGIGGRTTIGKNSWIGLAAAIVNGTSVGNNARANMGAVITKPIPDGGSYSGNFAIEHSAFLKNMKKLVEQQEE